MNRCVETIVSYSTRNEIKFCRVETNSRLATHESGRYFPYTTTVRHVYREVFVLC